MSISGMGARAVKGSWRVWIGFAALAVAGSSIGCGREFSRCDVTRTCPRDGDGGAPGSGADASPVTRELRDAGTSPASSATTDTGVPRGDGGATGQADATSALVVTVPDAAVRDASVVDAAVDARRPEHADASPDAGTVTPDPGIATAGAPCATEGAAACAGLGSRARLTCTGGTWTAAADCVAGTVCDPNPGVNRGTCQPIAAECIGHTTTAPYCSGNDLVSCPDLLSATHVTCPADSTCDPSAGACACHAGYLGTPGSCVDIDECKINHGGCDDLVTCTNQPGTFLCGPCPSGYVLSGRVCVPVLTSLAVSGGTLAPAFAPTVTSYQVLLPLTTDAVTLTPTAASGVGITISAQSVASGSDWISPTLSLGKTPIPIALSQVGRGGQSYTVNVSRGGQEALLRASTPAQNDEFGTSSAIDGDTMVVGNLSGAATVFVRSGTTWTPQATLRASNPDPGDYFGMSVAISGDTVVVGAQGESSAARTINGIQTDNSASNSGAAYVFVRSGTTWTQQAYLKASNADAGDRFGYAVTISGSTVVVGAPDESSAAKGIAGAQSDNTASWSGAAYVFVRSGTTWSQQAYVKASNTGANDGFGGSVALSSNTLVVGSTGEDSAATSINGSQSDDSATDSGAAYVFTRSGSTWTQQAYVKPTNTAVNDFFGGSVAVSFDTVVVGSGADNGPFGVHDGRAHVFVRSGSTWTQQAALSSLNYSLDYSSMSYPFFGSSVAISSDLLIVGAPADSSDASGLGGDPMNVNNPQSGAAYLFERSGSTWTLVGYVKASAPGMLAAFGTSVAISGGTFVVGSPDKSTVALRDGAAYVFR